MTPTVCSSAAGSGTTSQIICVILEQAERWQDAHSQVNLLYLLDAILQVSTGDSLPLSSHVFQLYCVLTTYPRLSLCSTPLGMADLS